MARRRRNRDGVLPHWRAVVGRDQIAIQRYSVATALFRKREEARGKVAGPVDYEEIRQLEIQLAMVDAAGKELSQRPVKKRGLKDKIVEALWFWATRDRFNRPG